jgi:hypothetical protein
MTVAHYEPNTPTFGELKAGDCFYSPSDDDIYIKADEKHKALRVKNGTLSDFDNHERIVFLPDAHLEID